VHRFEPNLRIPGPTHLPPSVREAGSLAAAQRAVLAVVEAHPAAAEGVLA